PQVIQVPVFVVVPLPSPPAPPPATPAEAAPAEAPPAAPASATALARAPPPGSASGEAAGRDVDLAAERAVLEIARNAVGRADGAAALVAVERHAAASPRGRLTEEREALWIQALALAGRRADARARAEQFRVRFPKSMLRPAIAAMLDGEPEEVRR